MDMPEYLRVVDLCDRVVRAARSDDGGPTVAGTFLGQLAELLDPVAEKGRGPSYQRGRADGRIEQRAAEGQLPEDIARISVWCRAIAQKARAQGNEALAATAPRIAEELDRALAGHPLEYARDPDPGGLEVVAYLRDRGLLPVDDGDQPPFAPELADAPLVTGESGAPAPLVVDQPVHESTLPAELGRGPLPDFPSSGPDDEGTHYAGDGCQPPHDDPTAGGPGA